VTPRTGRPKLDNPKNVDIKVRVDQETNARLLTYAKRNGMTRVEVVRTGIELVLNSDK
jgi:predicted DNA-binding protein